MEIVAEGAKEASLAEGWAEANEANYYYALIYIQNSQTQQSTKQR